MPAQRLNATYNSELYFWLHNLAQEKRYTFTSKSLFLKCYWVLCAYVIDTAKIEKNKVVTSKLYKYHAYI